VLSEFGFSKVRSACFGKTSSVGAASHQLSEVFRSIPSLASPINELLERCLHEP
jgi:hypothetical protein